MNITGLIAKFSNVRISSVYQLRSLVPTTYSAFHTSAQLNAEPLKKKKRVDPAVLRMREERRKRKLEKGIRQLKKHGKKLKPIDEMEVPPTLQREISKRRRGAPVLTYETCQERAALQRAWTTYRQQMHRCEASMIERVVAAQSRALEELYNESPELYQAAIQPDHTLLPFCLKAIVETPPIKGYEVPDGLYEDTTKKWRP
uniref:Large ribosomal subunit protein mL40 n=1 Tax=Ornithodoros turicata TaxID=34597 RepID=A0A2R5LAE5_9ACAR